MSRSAYDVAVVGLGAMGSAALCYLARAGLRTIGLERFSTPHVHGSSHGGSRIIREAYFEDPCYVPLVQRAYELWAALEADAQRRLLISTGGVMIGPSGSVLVEGALASARAHGLTHELLAASEITRRFPALRPAPEMVGVWEPRAGVLLPEECVSAHLEQAVRAGAEVRTNTAVNGWSASNGGLTVHTDTGDLHTGHVVLAAGAWMPALTRDVALRLAVERVVQAWFEPVGEAATLGPDSCPITIWEYERSRHFYAFPAMDGAVKAALHHQGEIVDPERVRREVSDGEVQGILEPLRRHIPSAVGRFRRALTCLYTNTPDEDFIIDRHPGNPRVVLVSACSGHGFKFASAIGETVAKMVKSGEPPPVPARFGLSRFVRPAGVREA